MSEVMSATWLRDVVDAALETVTETVVKPIVDSVMADGYPPRTEPLTLSRLMEKDPQQAAQLLARMIGDPQTQRRGVELAAQYVKALEKRAAEQEARLYGGG
jgi:hypothetical protein